MGNMGSDHSDFGGLMDQLVRAARLDQGINVERSMMLTFLCLTE